MAGAAGENLAGMAVAWAAVVGMAALSMGGRRASQGRADHLNILWGIDGDGLERPPGLYREWIGPAQEHHPATRLAAAPIPDRVHVPRLGLYDPDLGLL